MLAKAVLVTTLLVGIVHAEYHLVWSDEFNGASGLHDTEWVYDVGFTDNNELECYTNHRKENVRIEGGHLILHARPERFHAHKQCDFTSGRIKSKSAWTYGKFEARARLPGGKQLWPAIWMLPRDDKYGFWSANGEIDIMEYRGDKTNEISGTIHYGGIYPNVSMSSTGDRQFPVDFSKDFHIFAVEWTHKEISWHLDGKKFHSVNIDRNMWSGKGKNPYTANGQPFDAPFFWVLNVAVGGDFFGEEAAVTQEQARHWPKPTMEVDYVRVYQMK